MPTPSRLAGGAGDAASLKVSYNILPAGLTNLGLKIGDTVDGFIVHCENTDAIYIHLTKDKDEIDTIHV
ncbi:hypothetical protein EB796_009668 [Bugula neritina]|uniref:Uncharacterized protein n=1 Tax=Bugula neritina TaxID=10212 RepID=A0A7J7K1E5_BUGNE|nr:hypothetical protein EB796_009668 [Bugula neritina]